MAGCKWIISIVVLISVYNMFIRGHDVLLQSSNGVWVPPKISNY